MAGAEPVGSGGGAKAEEENEGAAGGLAGLGGAGGRGSGAGAAGAAAAGLGGAFGAGGLAETGGGAAALEGGSVGLGRAGAGGVCAAGSGASAGAGSSRTSAGGASAPIHIGLHVPLEARREPRRARTPADAAERDACTASLANVSPRSPASFLISGAHGDVPAAAAISRMNQSCLPVSPMQASAGGPSACGRRPSAPLRLSPTLAQILG